MPLKDTTGSRLLVNDTQLAGVLAFRLHSISHSMLVSSLKDGGQIRPEGACVKTVVTGEVSGTLTLRLQDAFLHLTT